jgi:hypothetical protein
MARRTLLGVVAAVLVVSGSIAEAQSVAFALVPAIQVSNPLPSSAPKYTTPGALGAGLDLVGWSAYSYGVEPIFVLRMPNLSAAQRTALQSQPDALVLPANLDANVSALALSRIQQTLEAANLPGNWVTTAQTYRDVLRGLRKVMTFQQRWNGLFGDRLFVAGVTLDTRLNQLSQDQRQKLASVADDLGLDRSQVTTTMALRQALRLMADQLPDDPSLEGSN